MSQPHSSPSGRQTNGTHQQQSSTASPSHRQSNASSGQYAFEPSPTPNGSIYPKHHHQDSRGDLGVSHAPHLHNFPCNADGYDVLAEIGVGAFATVYRGVVKDTQEEVAIKVVDLEQFNTNWDEARREILTMSLLHHSNIVRILTSFVDGQDLWIVMPLLKAGSCAALMKMVSPNGFKDEVLIATILRESLRGLEYLHKDGRIHRDVKAGNILVGINGDIQLGDFGVAAALLENGDRQRNRQTFTGTPCWMAPEVMEHTTGYDEKADIWSFGITAMELGYGRAPYARYQPMKVMLLTLQEDPPTTDIYKDDSYKFSKNYHSMISKCLRKDPKKRPSAKKLLEHKFFKIAEDNHYVLNHLVKRVPEARLNGTDSGSERPHICREKTLIDKQKVEKSKPVSVGSWVFDADEFQNYKQNNADAIAQEMAAHRQQQPAQSVADDESHSDEDEHHAETSQMQQKVQEMNQRQQAEQAQLLDPNEAAAVQAKAGTSRQGRFTVTEDDDQQSQNEVKQVENQVGRFSIRDD